MKDKIEVLISEEEVRARIKEMAKVLSEKYEGKDLVLVGILSGSVFFLTQLAQDMSIPVEIDFISASSYGSGTESSGKVIIKKDLDRDVEGRNVVVVEDIVDTGQTLRSILEMIEEKNPASLEVCVLLDKPVRRKVRLEADYIGFQIPDRFVVGWGLDYDQKYRDLPFIGVLEK